MANRFFTLAGGTLLGVLITSFTFVNCQHLGNHTTPTTQLSSPAATTPANAISSLPANELRDVLSDLAKSHGDHIQLAWWVSTPLRPVDTPFRPFFENMGARNKELQNELKAWAKSHNINLARIEKPGLETAAQKIMDKRQEDLVRNDNKTNFQHDILMQMFIDYEWNLSVLKALIPLVSDSALKAYLQKSEKMYSDGSAEILTLLHRYKFQ